MKGLYDSNALTNLDSEEDWILANMGNNALEASRLGELGILGYPRNLDESVVMFYDKSVINNPETIATIPDLMNAAQSSGLKVCFDLTNAFYGTAALMSYNEGDLLYKFSVNGSSQVSISSSFNSSNGLKGARLISDLYANYGSIIKSTNQTPGLTNGILATITYAQFVPTMKNYMGANYAVAPVPFIDNTKTTRLGTFEQYSFLGVNKAKIGSDQEKISVAKEIAKFLSSEYAQHEGLINCGSNPSCLSLKEEARGQEDYIDAIYQQEVSNSTFTSGWASSTLWYQVQTALSQIKNLATSGTVTDNALTGILADLDTALNE